MWMRFYWSPTVLKGREDVCFAVTPLADPRPFREKTLYFYEPTLGM